MPSSQTNMEYICDQTGLGPKEAGELVGQIYVAGYINGADLKSKDKNFDAWDEISKAAQGGIEWLLKPRAQSD